MKIIRDLDAVWKVLLRIAPAIEKSKIPGAKRYASMLYRAMGDIDYTLSDLRKMGRRERARLALVKEFAREEP